MERMEEVEKREKMGRKSQKMGVSFLFRSSFIV